MNIIVAGDCMVDTITHADFKRLDYTYDWRSTQSLITAMRSPVTYAPGGAANVAYNVHTMIDYFGKDHQVYLIGSVGVDTAADILQRKLTGINQFLLTHAGSTTVKNNVFIYNNNVIYFRFRLDVEDTTKIVSTKYPVEVNYAERLCLLKNVTDVIFVASDYSKGFMSEANIITTMQYVRNKQCPLFVDPGLNNYKMWSYAKTIFKPNKKQACAFIDERDVLDSRTLAVRVAQRLESEHVEYGMLWITLDKDGSVYKLPGQPPVLLTHKRKVSPVDTSGGGDTALAAAVAFMASKNGSLDSLPEAFDKANIAASIAVEHLGTYAVSADDLKGVIDGQ